MLLSLSEYRNSEVKNFNSKIFLKQRNEKKNRCRKIELLFSQRKQGVRGAIYGNYSCMLLSLCYVCWDEEGVRKTLKLPRLEIEIKIACWLWKNSNFLTPKCM